MKKRMKWLSLLGIGVALVVFGALYGSDLPSSIGEKRSVLSGDVSPESVSASLPRMARRIAEGTVELWRKWRGRKIVEPEVPKPPVRRTGPYPPKPTVTPIHVPPPAIVRAGRLVDELSAGLDEVDQLLADRQTAAALKTVDELSERFGDMPEFRLRRGLAFLDDGQLHRAAESLTGDFSGQLDRFFDEVNRRLKNLHIDLPQKTSLPRLSLNEVKVLAGREPVVYGSAGLNNHDWSANVQRSLNEVVSGHRVFRLRRIDIANFNPATIYAPQVSTTILQRVKPRASTGPSDQFASYWIGGAALRRLSAESDDGDVLLVIASEDDH